MYRKKLNQKLEKCDLKTLKRMDEIRKINVFEEDIEEYITYKNRKKANDQIKNFQFYKYALLHIA